MGIFDKFKKPKETKENLPLPNTNLDTKNEILLQDNKLLTQEMPSMPETEKIKIDLILSEINNIKMQMEMLNEKLKIIEKKIDQKGTIRYV